MQTVFNGIDRLSELDKVLRGQRVAVVTGGGAVNRELVPVVDVLCQRYNVTALWNTIYGIRGEFKYGERVPRYIDSVTGREVISIFNKERIAPSPEMLAGVDVVVFDIREAGTRFFEYLHCCAALMKACAAAGKPLVILDRIAPIGGVKVEGTVCPASMHLIVGDYELASRTAMTMGEFARYVNGEYGVGCNLTVIPVEGWTREMYADDTDLPWLLPSPSLNSCTANLLYAGMCVFEGVTTISEGRGTSKPFELIGAPWANAYELAQRMNHKELEGVRFAPVYFKPASSVHQGEVCQGVQVLIQDRACFESFRTAITLLDTFRELWPEKIEWADCTAGHEVCELPSAPTFTRYLDKLLADPDYTAGVLNGDQLIARHADARARYAQRKAKYHLYE